jgi:transcriptional regulator with XRE-family HTH domain
VDPGPSEWLLALGKAIREVRLERGHTQQSLGDETGIHRNYVGGIERGERSPTVKRIVVIANELKIDLDDLFSRAADLLMVRSV